MAWPARFSLEALSGTIGWTLWERRPIVCVIE